MDDFNEDIELIDALLSGSLDQKQSEDIKQRLMIDPSFKKLYDEQKLIYHSFSRNERQKLWNKLTQDASSLDASTNGKKSKQIYFLWAAAAAILVTLGVVYFTQDNLNYQEIFNQYYEPVENLNYPIPRGDESKVALSEAARLYTNGSYSETIKKLEGLPVDNDILFIRGITMLALEKHEIAVKTFLEISTDFDRIDDVYWYTSLAYIALNDRSNALAELSKIQDKGKYPTQELIEVLR